MSLAVEGFRQGVNVGVHRRGIVLGSVGLGLDRVQDGRRDAEVVGQGLSDITLITGLGIAIVALGVGLAPALFSVTNDEDFARSTGLPVRTLSLLIAILSALTVAVAMRVVGSLLVSALMVIPVAIAQLGARSFRSTMAIAMALGIIICTCGLSLTYFVDLSPGATIVVGAIGLYAIGFTIRAIVDRIRRVRRLRAARGHNQHPEREHLAHADAS